MCGLNGIFAYNAAASMPERTELIATRDQMIARGPDGCGEWWSEDRRLGLGHRRLSIIDLSERGNQPMISACKRYAVAFNGEIYNYPDLRRDLEAERVEFRTKSDTEVLLLLYAREGAAMLPRLRGMFAFAIWDNEARELFLARDPYGIKPMYVADDGSTFRFASQVKALLAGGRVSREPDPAGIVGFHIWGSVPDPFTLYRAVSALPAGYSQRVTQDGPQTPRPFCSISQIFAAGADHPAPARAVDAMVRKATLDSLSAHLLADVEVGVFLSAGIDSGALLGLMRDAGQQKIRAITLGFEEFRGTSDDEAPLATQIAELYGADHVVRTVGEKEFQADIPAILDAMDQPSIDGVNTWFVAKAAREAGLKVALSGLGGDELLAGYSSFRHIPQLVSCMRLPAAIPGAAWVARKVLGLLGVGAPYPKLLGLMQYGGTYEGAYLLRRSLFLPFELSTVLEPGLVRKGLERLRVLDSIRESMTPRPSNAISRVAALESTSYMRIQLLRDADWAGMAHSLEIRTPFVDIDLLRALSSVTPRLTPGVGKRALARAPLTPLPASITDRPKTGFSVPTGRWQVDAIGPVQSPKGLTSRRWGRAVLAHALG